MGIVHAKGPDTAYPAMVGTKGLPPPPPPGHHHQGQHKVLVLDNKDAKVEHVHIEGLQKTKSDMIAHLVKDVLSATSIEEAIKKSNSARNKMEDLGIFKRVNIFIDTSKGPSAHPNGLDVTFKVKESKRMSGGVHTLVGNNEGSLVVGLKSPNVFGRAEKIISEYSYGTKKSSGFHVSFIKPFRGDLQKSFTASVFKVVGDFAPSGYKDTDKGVSLDLSFPSFVGKQSLRWEGIWRELNCLSRTTSFAVREEAGHTLKSSLKHIYTCDTRNEAIFPSSGYLIKLNQELAGYTGGDVKFLKEEVEFQFNQSLFWDSVLSCSLTGGILKPLDSSTSHILDRFFLGGPNSIRGFSLRGIGPHSDGDAIGAEAFWAAGLHLYTPLPFNPGKGGFGDLFRTHFFVNAGNLGNVNFDDTWNANLDRMLENLRWSYGAGVVLRLGRIARIEINYCVPMRAENSDKITDGLQIGVGINFL